MAYRSPLECVGFNERELARPATDIPIETINKIGSRLQMQTQNGDWKIVAEELGYTRDEIDAFQSQADVSRTLPGVSLLHHWSSQGNGRTIFVLRDVLYECGRLDCIDLLDRSIREKLLSVPLYIQIEDEEAGALPSLHKIHARSSALLRDSLNNLLCGEVDTFQIVQKSFCWNRTIARDLKGQQLILRRNSREAGAATSRHELHTDVSQPFGNMETVTNMQDSPKKQQNSKPSKTHCGTCCCRESSDQCQLVSSSSPPTDSDSQISTKQFTTNLKLNSRATHKKRKLDLSTPGTSDGVDVDMVSETFGLQNLLDVSQSEKMAVENEDMTAAKYISTSMPRYEPLRSFSGDETVTKVPFVPQSPGSRFFKHSHKPPDKKSCVLNCSHVATLADTLTRKTVHGTTPLSQSLPPTLPSRNPIIPPRLPITNCEVQRSIKERVPENEYLKQLDNMLKDVPGWCPYETKDTISSSLKPICHEDGNYIIWYMRTPGKLVMSISHLKSIVHYEIHVKTEDGETKYFFYPDHKFSSLSMLMEYHKQQGLEPQRPTSEPCSLLTNPSFHTITRFSHVRPKCAVRIHYSMKRNSV